MSSYVVSIIAGAVLLLFSGGQEDFSAWGQAGEPGINLLRITHGGQDDALPDGEDVDPGAFTAGSPTGDPNTPYDFQLMKLKIIVPSGDIPECESGGPYPVNLTLPEGVMLLNENGTHTIDTLKFEESTLVQVKATQPSQQLRDIEITSTVEGGEAIDDDVVKATAVVVDLDIDSDNDDGFNVDFEQDDDEDQIEDIENDPTTPGKFLAVNDGDADNDGIPDFADFDASVVYPGNTPVRFTPLVLELPEPLELEKVKIRLTYSASAPNGVSGSGTQAEPYAAAPGYLRIWNVDGSVKRNIAEVSSGGEGHYVKPDSEYTPSALGPGREIRLFVEGIKESASMAEQQIKVEIDPNGDDEEPEFIGEDVVRVTVIRVDLDIDSDNNNGVENSDEGEYEDQIENIQDDLTKPGKLIAVNNGNDDTGIPDNAGNEDEIPDFADGFNLNNNPGDFDDINTQEQFFPLILKLSKTIDLTHVRIKLTYDDSDPANVRMVDSVTGQAPEVYDPAPGSLRIWKKNGNVARNKNSIQHQNDSGDYIPEGIYQPSELGFSANKDRIRLFVEGIRASESPADLEIIAELDIDNDNEFDMKDTVRVTAVGMELQNRGRLVRPNSVDEAFIENDAQNNPIMPQLVVELVPEGILGYVNWQFVTTYTRDNRNDNDSYSWTHDVQFPWDIANGVFGFHEDYRGGKAVLHWEYVNYVDTFPKQKFVFHIRGHNATEQAVRDYIAQFFAAQGIAEPWYFRPIARHESDRPSQGRFYAQFNEPGILGPNHERHTRYCPNWGVPHGWGIMQLDNPPPYCSTTLELAGKSSTRMGAT